MKQLVGLVVVPEMEWTRPKPGMKYLIGVDPGLEESVSASWNLLVWVQQQRVKAIRAAMLQGHEGPWTFEYHLDGSRVLKDGKGVACG